jgi:hypothetical protein
MGRIRFDLVGGLDLYRVTDVVSGRNIVKSKNIWTNSGKIRIFAKEKSSL